MTVMLAIKNGNYEISEKLIQYSEANLSIANTDGVSTLSIALSDIQDDGQMLDLLLKKINLEKEGMVNMFADNLELYINGRMKRQAKILINKFPSYLHKKDKCGKTAFSVTLNRFNYELAELIINNTPKNQQDELQFKLLTQVIGLETNPEIIKKHLTNNKDIFNKQNQDGKTLLIFTAYNGNYDAAKLLVENGADVNTANNKDNDYTPLMYAIDNNKNKTAETLINSGICALNKQSTSGYTALMKAIFAGKVEIALQLIKKLKKDGADLNLQNEKGETALMLAILNGHHNIVEQLVKTGVNLNPQDGKGVTALIIAIAENLPDIVEILVDSGADIKQKSGYGTSPIKLSKHLGHSDITKILKNKESKSCC